MSLFWRLLAISLLVIAVAVGLTALTVGRAADTIFSKLMMSLHIETAELRALFVAEMTRSLLVTSLIAATVGVLLSAILVRAVTRPVREMCDLAVRIAAGDYAARVGPSGALELRQLGVSLNRMAESLTTLERLRKDLVADVAHELRTPLTNLRGYLEALRDGVAPASPETVGLLHDEVMRLVRLVEDLHDLSRLEARLPQLRLERVDLGELTTRLVALRREEFAARGIAIRVVAPPRVVRADADLVAQAVTNLLDNALKYTPPSGTVAVEVGGDEARVQLGVTNTGEGIAPEDLPYVFERFYRGEKSRSRDSGGSGIGLAIVQEVTRAHGGQAGAESRSGRTTVWIALPA